VTDTATTEVPRRAAGLRAFIEKAWWSFLPELSGGKIAKLTHSGKDVFFRVQSQTEGLRQAETLTREPWVATWLGEHVRADEVLYDIGASVGTYALLAAEVAEARVFAFESDSQLLERLAGNIALNRRADRVVSVPLTLAASTGIGRVSDDGDSAGMRAVLSFRLDDLRDGFSLPSPDHLRLDVLRAGRQALDGAVKTLATPSLKTALVRAAADAGPSVEAALGRAGLSLVTRHDVPPSNGATTSWDALWVRR
jgi:FkbM family methyltransferase